MARVYASALVSLAMSACGDLRPQALALPPGGDVAELLPAPVLPVAPHDELCMAPGPDCMCEEEAGESTCFTAFEWRITPLPDRVRQEMLGVSWHEGCPLELDHLRLLQLTHWNFAGEIVWGELVVAGGAAPVLRDVFEKIYAARFPIERMERIEAYGGSDHRSMAANNSSAFNCRSVSGGASWSEHAFGTAVDLNPIQNPWVKGDRVEPSSGRPYADRARVRQGMITAGDPVVEAFTDAGWRWGGAWRHAKDYQHFSASGR